MANSLPEYPAFMPKDSPDDAARWTDWLEGFKAMLSAMNIPEDSAAVPAVEAIPASEGQEATPAVPGVPAKTERFDKLWHYLGKEGRKCLKGLENNGVEARDYNAAQTALTACFGKSANNIYQFHVLRSMRQGEDSMDKYYRRIKEHKELMKLESLSKEQLIELIILSHLVDTTSNKSAMKKCLKDGLGLKQFLDHCRLCEQTDRQLEEMEKKTISYAQKKKPSEKHRSEPKKNNLKHKGKADKSTKPKADHSTKCKYCAGHCSKGQCPAFGKTCGFCLRRNHLEEACYAKENQIKKGNINQLGKETEDEDSEDEAESDASIYHTGNKTRFFSELAIETPEGIKKLSLQLDTGASCSTLALHDYEKLTTSPPQAFKYKAKTL